jgi:hypothetical protein
MGTENVDGDRNVKHTHRFGPHPHPGTYIIIVVTAAILIEFAFNQKHIENANVKQNRISQ